MERVSVTPKHRPVEPVPVLLAAHHERDPGGALWHPGGERPVRNHLRGLQMLRMLWGKQTMLFFHICALMAVWFTPGWLTV